MLCAARGCRWEVARLRACEGSNGRTRTLRSVDSRHAPGGRGSVTSRDRARPGPLDGLVVAASLGAEVGLLCPNSDRILLVYGHWTWALYSIS